MHLLLPSVFVPFVFILWRYPYGSLLLLVSLISLLLGFTIGRYKDILTWLKGEAANSRYSYLVDRLLTAIERRDVDETREVFIDFVYFLGGTTRYRPIRYVGERFECPITKEDMDTGSIVLILPCGHMGKYDEMKQWIDENTRCPCCNATS